MSSLKFPTFAQIKQQFADLEAKLTATKITEYNKKILDQLRETVTRLNHSSLAEVQKLNVMLDLETQIESQIEKDYKYWVMNPAILSDVRSLLKISKDNKPDKEDLSNVAGSYDHFIVKGNIYKFKEELLQDIVTAPAKHPEFISNGAIIEKNRALESTIAQIELHLKQKRAELTVPKDVNVRDSVKSDGSLASQVASIELSLKNQKQKLNHIEQEKTMELSEPSKFQFAIKKRGAELKHVELQAQNNKLHGFDVPSLTEQQKNNFRENVYADYLKNGYSLLAKPTPMKLSASVKVAEDEPIFSLRTSP